MAASRKRRASAAAVPLPGGDASTAHPAPAAEGASPAPAQQQQQQKAPAAAVPQLPALPKREVKGSAEVGDGTKWVIRPGPPLESIYRLEECLGQGSFGVVRRAVHLVTGQVVAVKTIRKELLTPSDEVKLRREVEVMHHLAGHPHIAQLLGVHEERDYLHLVMELYEGGDMYDAIVAAGIHSERTAADAMRAVLKAVSYCHAMGVAHRDLKPENFMLTAPRVGEHVDKDEPHVGSRLKLIDFGLSTFCTDATPLADTVGSAYYVAPEVLERCYGRSADMWSCGVILHVLLTGCAPFGGRTDQEILAAVRKGRLDLTHPIYDGLSPGAREALTVMLDRDPEQRATAEEMLGSAWLGRNASECTAPATPLPGVVSERLRAFAKLDSFAKEARRVVAGLLKQEEVAGLVAAFHDLDEDGDGKLSTEELRKGLTRQELQWRASAALDAGMSEPVPEQEATGLVARSDCNGDGKLDLSEFLGAALPAHLIRERAVQALATAATLPRNREVAGRCGSGALLQPGLSKRHGPSSAADAAAAAAGGHALAAAFAHFDADGSGYITADELVRALAAHHPNGGAPDVKELLASVDTDSDGRISYREFLAMMLRVAEAEASPAALGPTAGRAAPLPGPAAGAPGGRPNDVTAFDWSDDCRARAGIVPPTVTPAASTATVPTVGSDGSDSVQWEGPAGAGPGPAPDAAGSAKAQAQAGPGPASLAAAVAALKCNVPRDATTDSLINFLSSERRRPGGPTGAAQVALLHPTPHEQPQYHTPLPALSGSLRARRRSAAGVLESESSASADVGGGAGPGPRRSHLAPRPSDGGAWATTQIPWSPSFMLDALGDVPAAPDSAPPAAAAGGGGGPRLAERHTIAAGEHPGLCRDAGGSPRLTERHTVGSGAADFAATSGPRAKLAAGPGRPSPAAITLDLGLSDLGLGPGPGLGGHYDTVLPGSAAPSPVAPATGEGSARSSAGASPPLLGSGAAGGGARNLSPRVSPRASPVPSSPTQGRSPTRHATAGAAGNATAGRPAPAWNTATPSEAPPSPQVAPPSPGPNSNGPERHTAPSGSQALALARPPPPPLVTQLSSELEPDFHFRPSPTQGPTCTTPAAKAAVAATAATASPPREPASKRPATPPGARQAHPGPAPAPATARQAAAAAAAAAASRQAQNARNRRHTTDCGQGWRELAEQEHWLDPGHPAPRKHAESMAPHVGSSGSQGSGGGACSKGTLLQREPTLGSLEKALASAGPAWS